MFAECVRWAVKSKLSAAGYTSYNASFSFKIAQSATLPFTTILLMLTHYLLFPKALSDSIMGCSGWKKRVATSQTTTGSFQDHQKTTTVDGHRRPP